MKQWLEEQTQLTKEICMHLTSKNLPSLFTQKTVVLLFCCFARIHLSHREINLWIGQLESDERRVAPALGIKLTESGGLKLNMLSIKPAFHLDLCSGTRV